MNDPHEKHYDERMQSLGLYRLLEHWFGLKVNGANVEISRDLAVSFITNEVPLSFDEEKFDQLLSDAYRRASALEFGGENAALEIEPKVDVPKVLSAGVMATETASTVGLIKKAVVQQWRGLVSGMHPLPMASAPALDGSEPQELEYLGVQIPLDRIFDEDAVKLKLRWASGPLRIMCSQSANSIRSIKVSLDRSIHDDGADILVELVNREGIVHRITLCAERPSVVVRISGFSPDFKSLNVTVSLLSDEPPQC